MAELTNAENNRRIAKNMLLLYVRMFFLMGISLYTSRVVLSALGVQDYGVYNVLGGLVMMFTVLSGSLSAAISRFLTFELGKGDKKTIADVFSASVTIQIGLALIIIFLAETVGFWFVNNKMVIPEDRMVAANWCYQLSILAFCINLISIPYNAAIIAHERMTAFTYISIIEALGKLLVAVFISIYSNDRLICYSALIVGLAVLIRIIYIHYCKTRFEECTYHFIYDTNVLKKMFSFAGWNFIGASSSILRDQGTNVLLNLYFGPVVNSARGVSMQVSAAVSSFVNSFLTAIKPQITKSFAVDNREYTYYLVFIGARVSYYLLLLISLPLIIEAPLILSLWLEIVPDFTVVFVRLILIYIMMESVSYTMTTLVLATGDIKKYQLIVGGCQMLNFPVSLAALELGAAPEMTIVISIIIAIGCLLLRLWILKDLIEFPSRRFVKEVLINIILVSIISMLIPFAFVTFIDDSIMRLFMICLISLLSVCITIFFIGCSNKERNIVLEKINGRIKMIKK